MKKLKIRKWLFDMKMAIEDIEIFLGGQRFEELQTDQMMVKRAVERELEIIGEALRRIVHIEKDIEITAKKEIIGTRNYIIHEYDGLDESTITKIIDEDLPILKIEVDELLKTKYYDDDAAD